MVIIACAKSLVIIDWGVSTLRGLECVARLSVAISRVTTNSHIKIVKPGMSCSCIFVVPSFLELKSSCSKAKTDKTQSCCDIDSFNLY